MKRVFVLLTLIIIAAVGSFLYYREGTLPVNKKVETPKIFVVARGENLASISKKLAEQGLIRNKIIFFLVVTQLGIQKNIQAGDFRLSPSMDVYEIAKSLTHGTLDEWITIIEGMRKEEIAQLVAKSLNIPETEFIREANEGYLFPDTYLIPKDATAGSVINILTDNFYKKFSDDLKRKAEAKGLTEKEVVILASFVEREAKFDADRKIVANILLRRYKEGMPLQVDATVQYALGYQAQDKTWWKQDLSVDDLQIKSAYNTYKNKELPPTPIDNPGLAAIEAVINANANTPYLFYVSDKSGKLHFARDLDGHNENIRKYLK